MVGGDDDERLVGMCTVELEHAGNDAVEAEHLADGRAAVVAVERVVDHAVLDHHEEGFGRIFLEVGEAGVDGGEQGEADGVGIGAVDGIAQLVVVAVVLGVEQEDAFRL